MFIDVPLDKVSSAFGLVKWLSVSIVVVDETRRKLKSKLFRWSMKLMAKAYDFSDPFKKGQSNKCNRIGFETPLIISLRFHHEDGLVLSLVAHRACI